MVLATKLGSRRSGRRRTGPKEGRTRRFSPRTRPSSRPPAVRSSPARSATPARAIPCSRARSGPFSVPHCLTQSALRITSGAREELPVRVIYAGPPAAVRLPGPGRSSTPCHRAGRVRPTSTSRSIAQFNVEPRRLWPRVTRPRKRRLPNTLPTRAGPHATQSSVGVNQVTKSTRQARLEKS